MTTIDYLMTEGAVPHDCIPYQEKREMCTYRCYDPFSKYDKYYCKTGSMKIETTHEGIKKELFQNGPMMMGLQIYEDFMNYSSGIYRKTTGDNIGGHAMKLVGYGEDPQLGLYWEL